MKLVFNDKDALEELKLVFPKDWEKEVAYGIHRLKVLRNIYKCDTATAIKKYLDSDKPTPAKILFIACAYLLTNIEANEDAVACIDIEISNLLGELEKLREAQFTQANKNMLASYYNNKIVRHVEKKEILTLSAPVIRPVGIDYKSRVLR